MKKTIVILIAVAFLMGFMTVPIRADVLVENIEITVVRDNIDPSLGNPTLRYLLINPSVDADDNDFEPFDPTAVLMLFTGGSGRLRLEPGDLDTGSKNFVVRTRYHFAAEGFVVAVIDAASDFLDHGHASRRDLGFRHRSGLRGHRLPARLHGDKYLLDLAAVIEDLRGKFDLPLWAVGTSRGTISAAVAAAELDDPPDGIVLTSSVTGPSGNGDLRPRNIDLGLVDVPTLIVSNEDDECRSTKPEDSEDLKERFTASPRVKFRDFDGGNTPLSRSCGPLSPHGFFGIEQEVVDAIGKFIEKDRDEKDD